MQRTHHRRTARGHVTTQQLANATEDSSTLARYAWPYLGALDSPLSTAARGCCAARRYREQAASPMARWLRAARGHRPKGPNLGRVDGSNSEHVLPRPSKVARVNHHAAVPYGELPALMAQLKTRDGVGVKALTFTITTAARSDETLGATLGRDRLRQRGVDRTVRAHEVAAAA